MTPTEIRQNKKKLVPILVSQFILIAGLTWYIFFSGKLPRNNTLTFFWALSTGMMIFAGYKLAMKLRKNEPEIILSKDGIEINEKNGLTFFDWSRIAEWEIKKDDNTYFLFMETPDGKKKINVSWLEKTPADIEELIYEYKGQ